MHALIYVHIIKQRKLTLLTLTRDVGLTSNSHCLSKNEAFFNLGCKNQTKIKQVSIYSKPIYSQFSIYDIIITERIAKGLH